MSQNPALDEETVSALIMKALDQIGGPRSVYRNPRMAFARNAKRMVEQDGYDIEIRYGEISTPAIASVAGWVFQINDDDIEALMRPRKK